MRKSRDIIPSFDDILFESRNKEYGAYQLRKRYNRVVAAGVLISVFLGSAAVIIPSLNRDNTEYSVAGGGRYIEMEMEKLPPPEEMIYVAPPPPPPERTAAEEVVKYVPPVIVDTVFPMDQQPLATDEAITREPESEEEVYSNGIGEELFPGDGSAGDGEIFFLVEEMPTFRGGGLDKFREWITKRTNYPQAAIDAKIKGTVFITFVVEKDGSVSNVSIIKGVHPLLDNEAIKVISESPRWTPGMQRGQPVRIRYQIPVSFTL